MDIGRNVSGRDPWKREREKRKRKEEVWSDFEQIETDSSTFVDSRHSFLRGTKIVRAPR